MTHTPIIATVHEDVIKGPGASPIPPPAKKAAAPRKSRKKVQVSEEPAAPKEEETCKPMMMTQEEEETCKTFVSECHDHVQKSIATDADANVLSHLGSYIEEPYSIIESYFQGQHLERLVRHQIESYNNFINYQIQRTIQMFNPVLVRSENDYSEQHDKYLLEISVSFHNFKLYPPQIHENNGATKTMFPQEAKLRNFTYASAMMVDIKIDYIVRNTDSMDVPRTITKILPKINIGKMPIMLKSSTCVLTQNKSIDPVVMGECPLDCGGYFIIKGSEKTVLGQERAAENRVYCFDGKNTTKWSWFAEMKSIPDFKCISPKQIEMMIVSKNNGFGHGIYMNIPRVKQPIELFAVFRALGIMSDKAICEFILLDLDDENQEEIREFLQASVIDGNKYMTQEDALKHITAYVAYTPINMDKEKGAKKKQEFTVDVLNTDLFPHCKTLTQKLYMMGYMAQKLIKTSLGWLPPDDRDSYVNKRIELTGTLLNNLFRNYFNKLVKEMQKQIVREINNGSWRSMDNYENIINMTNIYKIMKSTTIENGINRALATGDFSIKQSNSSKVGVAQVLNRLTYAASLSHLRRVNTPLEKSGELIAPRKLHNTTWGFLCAAETPEGQSIGVVKNISYLSHITIPSNSSSLYEYILPNIVKLEDTTPQAMYGKVRVFINGAWVGITEHPQELYNEIKDKKYRGIINIYTSVVVDYNMMELRVCNDGGRLTRPVLKVRDNRALITAENIQQLTTNELNWNDLLVSCRIPESVVEYIDPEEQNFAMIALKSKEGYIQSHAALATANTLQYTHCEIHPSTIFGVLASCIPFPEHNQSPRNCYQCSSCHEEVWCADGKKVMIKDIKLGDRVLTFHPETLEISETSVVNHFIVPNENPVYSIKTVSGREFVFTGDHNFMTDRGWKMVDDIIQDPTIRIGMHMTNHMIDYHSLNDGPIRELLNADTMKEKLSQVGMVDDATKNKVSKWMSQLTSIGLLPLASNNPKLAILSRLMGMIFTDGSLSVQSTIPCTFCLGRRKDAENLTNDIEKLGFRRSPITEAHNECVIQGRFQIHHTFNVTYCGGFVALLLSLGSNYGKKTETSRKPIPDWIMENREYSRQFMKGFQGGDGCKIRWNWLRSCHYNFVCAETSQQIHPQHQESLVHMMQQCVTIMRRFDIETSDVKVVENKHAEDRMIVSFKISDKQDNLIRYYENIGYAYASTKNDDSFQVVEFLKTKMVFRETNEILVKKVRAYYDQNMREGRVTDGIYANLIRTQLAAENIKMDLAKIRDLIRSYNHGRTISTPDLKSFNMENWLSTTTSTKNGCMFVPIRSITRVEDQLVSCIETESENHSFITTHGILSKNCCMGKQAIGIYALNYDQRMDKTAYILNYPSRPLVDTRLMNFIQLNRIPSGHQIHVAIMSYTGYNQEDSVLINKGSIDRGLFLTTVYHTEKDEDKNIIRDEIIRCKPDPLKTKGIKYGNYGKLNAQGFIPENTLVENRDVIIAKTVPIKENRNDPTKTIKYEDQSKTFRTGEECYVDKNYTGRNGDGYNFAKVRVRTLRKPVLGDKFASRSGQKGTCGCIIPECDMPYTKDGLRPDIILNPHAIPSRMTIAQLKETVLAKVLIHLGMFGDGTSFGELDIHTICKELHRLGYESHGNEVMYDGLTGEQIETNIFIGPVFYLRLKHMVNDKQHSRSIGPMVNLTRQPAEGRSRDGGFRIGEMERDVLIAHGMSRFCRERMYDVSDKYSTHVCNKCGMIAAYNDESMKRTHHHHAKNDMSIHLCKTCNNMTDFSKVEIPYAYKLLSQELQTINVVARIITE